MFPRLQRKFVILYTLSTGLIMTFILSAAFLFYVSSQENRWKSAFQEHLFTLLSQLQTDARFSDSFLARMEQKNHLLIYMEENDVPFFFPGSYESHTPRETLFHYAEDAARAEGLYLDSHPISSNLLQSSVFQIDGDRQDVYLGNILVLQTTSGYKKLILLQDITDTKKKLLETCCVYLLIDLLGILLLFLSGRWFVRRSLKPLEDTYRKQQDFVAAASHELRSPLAVIQSTADALTARPEELDRCLCVIQNECRRGRTLVKNLLLLVSAEQKEWAVKKQKLEIDEMLLGLLELYEPQCHSRNGILLLRLPEDPLPTVSADPDLCRQILTILLDNAIAYALPEDTCTPKCPHKDSSSDSTSPSGTAACKRQIILQAEYNPGSVTIYVIDHGPGISDQDKALIFDRFYRSDKSRRDKEHFGLGLSIAAALAEIQGIRLNVEDTAGGGSTFSIRF